MGAWIRSGIGRAAVTGTLLLILIACRGGTPSPAPSSTAPPVVGLPNPLPDIVARVNGQPVGSLAVASRARELLLLEKVPKGQTAIAFRQALEELIAREALVQEATARSIVANEATVERVYNEARVLYPDESNWARHLAPRGLDPQSFRRELRVRLTVEALQQQEMDKAKPATDEEAKAFYDANPAAFNQAEPVRVRQIFIRKRSDLPEAWANEKGKAKALRERIRVGEDFGALAREFSEDPASQAKGGELPPFARGQMLKEVEDAVYALKVGEVSEVFETPLGFHVVKLDERLPPTKLSFDEAKELIKGELLRHQRDRAIRELTEAVTRKARVERFV